MKRFAILSIGAAGVFKARMGMEVECRELAAVKTTAAELASVQPLMKQRVAQAVHAMRVAVRGAYLALYVMIPFLWVVVLHNISEYLVSRKTLNDVALNFFKSSGPCFLKLGQWAATRPDIFGPEFCKVVSELHNEAPRHSWSETKHRLREAFGAEEVFASIDQEPLHSGCIAQVHKVTLKDRAGDYVVKVMHPDVEGSIRTDLSVIGIGVAALEFAIPQSKWLSMQEAFREFEALMNSQLDFQLEAANLLRFRSNFSDSASVSFPEPVSALTTKAVLVESFSPGTSISAYTNDSAAVSTKQRLATIGCNAFFKMVFEDNLFHADLHPGNILVTDQGAGLVMLDAGLVAELSRDDKKNFVELFAAVCVGDGALAGELILNGAKVSDCSDPQRFKDEMKAIVDRVSLSRNNSFSLRDVKIGEVLLSAMNTARTNKVKLDPNFTTLIISVTVLEGIGRALWPDLNLFKIAAPHVLPYVEASNVRSLAPIIMKQYL